MVIHFVPYPPHGGSLQRSFNLLREISRSNSVHLLALNQKALLPDEKSVAESIEALRDYCETIKVYKIPTDYNRFKWYTLLFLNLFSSKPFTNWWFKSNELAIEIKNQILSKDFDLIYLETIDLVQYVDFGYNIPRILNHQNVESSLLRRRAANEKNLLAKLYLYIQARKLRNYERRVLNKFDVNLAVSENDKGLFKQMVPGARFEVIPNGTDTEYFKPTGEDVSRELIFVGGLTWYPNRDAMIYFCEQVYPMIKKEFPEVIMNIIGRKPPDKILEFSRKDDSIKIHGFVKDTREFISRSAVFVVPIRVGGGTRLKILDAFACGKAVVSTSIGCEGIDVTPGENILIGDTAEEFASQVIRVMRDDGLRIRLERNARKLVEEKYSWEIIGGKLNRIFKSIAG
jgi:sugar transferase (PEP-CTERM/EpsH1 system associated)